MRRRLPGLRRLRPARLHEAVCQLGLKFPVVTGETGGDDALLHAFGDEALGMMSACPYTLDLDTDANKKFAQAM